MNWRDGIDMMGSLILVLVMLAIIFVLMALDW